MLCYCLVDKGTYIYTDQTTGYITSLVFFAPARNKHCIIFDILPEIDCGLQVLDIRWSGKLSTFRRNMLFPFSG